MSRSAAILRRSCQAATKHSRREGSPEQCSRFGVPWRWFSCAELTKRPGTSTPNQIKSGDQYFIVPKSSTPHSTAYLENCWLFTSKNHYNQSLGFSGVPSLRRMCSSYTRTKPEGAQNSVSKVSSAGTSEVGTAVDGGNTWIDMSENAHCSATDASTASKNLKDLNDAITFHVQELFSNHADLERVVVPLGGTLIGTAMAWFVMPIVLRKLHKYASEGPLMTIWGVSTKKDMSYQTSLWSAMEDPAKYIITFMAFSQIWKTNFIANAMAKQAAIATDRERLSAFDKVSSLGLIALGVVALAEACGVPVQSILTVGGVGGVATAFAARDILGNILSGFSLQFSRPFSVGDYIKAGSIEGQVVEIGLTSTSLINTEKLPVIVPNSLFSSQMIMNKSRAQRHVSVSKLPLRTEDIEKIPTITEEIKAMLVSNPKIDAPYCYLSRLEGSRGELTIGCNIKSTKTEEWSSVEQDILLKAAGIMKRHQLWAAV
ncbi:mechanosensitive ion channel protein 1, mitochondrial-like isoform X2 [Panicum miliaceum]|uniref:Mechanosensitive ion channel protein 1, mitochondrial-like isoform X2 n=1 Tax=Panicum miliaceum TaxID=4540 RepID=A0A3L6QBC2_PANMI|nr:mechanosensitive ion channel protein 1, mitochondrial-like isoform X2 [Panicum miliaceum]